MREAQRPRALQFLESQPFVPDRFQIEAAEAVDRGESVVVTAPTGAGKTLVAQAAVHKALGDGERSFYTTPVKALSNQKFAEFRAIYGDAGVGLLTGDNVINGGAPVVVMTTEVLRNMIYAESTALDRLGVVVLDEVHYLQDRYRGSVWEEVIIHLPHQIRIVALSATIANPEEFTGWIRERRGTTALVVEKHRPVPLHSLYALKDRQHGGQIAIMPVFTGKQPNQQVTKLLQKGRGRSRRFATPRRLEMAEDLRDQGLLPAIHFVFSRAGCDDAAALAAGSHLGLTTADERAAIRAVAQERTAHLPSNDLIALSHGAWVAALEQGVAAHHAGMVPAFKETVEDLFAVGLVKLVYATETLSLGINMPARTVVLDSLSKYTGDGHELIQPGDYTQLTGRAGRRGIDVEGTAVVLHSPYVPFDRAAGIAGAGSHVLVSSFQPTYNMAANLVANYDRSEAVELLRASFAEYREDIHRGALEERLADKEQEWADLRRLAACDRGDLWDFLAREDAGEVETGRISLIHQLEPGDVLDTGEGSTRDVLLVRSWGGRTPQFLMLDEQGAIRRLRPRDLPQGLRVLGTLDLPEPFRPRESDYQGEVALLLREWDGDGTSEIVIAAEVEDPVGGCPDLAKHRRFARRAARAETEVRRLRRRSKRRKSGLVPRFEAILDVLGRWGYVDGWSLTERGQRLRFVYNELDLLLTESIMRSIMSGLSSVELAAVTSLFTYESRPSDVHAPIPTQGLLDRVERVDEVWGQLAGLEEELRLPVSRRPDPGFAGYVHAWAGGTDLDDLFAGDELAAGDFVRNARQLLDLLRQVRDGFPELGDMAHTAIRAIDRGIVAAGGRL